jgi:hypothetical protein
MKRKMHDGGKILIGLIIGVGLLLFPFYYNAGKAAKAPDPVLTEKAKEAKYCVAPTPYMQRYHMQFLDDWRHTVVRNGDRYYDTSEGTWHLKAMDILNYTVGEDLGKDLKGFYEGTEGKTFYKSLQVTCMDCHSNKTKFCDQCHNYMGVDPYCWDCHIEPEEPQESQ